ncbi:MAG: D-alanyl-D-alanine carboxypeptidase [Microbacteriaceae bacterium]|nr:D-alanyl-D-alanine carboxypeptidase [Microbacteriaceae bacterium]
MLERGHTEPPNLDDPRVIAARPRRRRRSALVAVILLLLVSAAIGTYVSLSMSAPLDDATLTLEKVVVAQPAGAVIAAPMGVASAVSVVGAEEYLGAGISSESGGTEKRPIASITKVVTALVILDQKPLDPGEAGPTLTFSEADNDLYDKYFVMGATIHPMKIGSTMTERDALETMLVVSASNYAEAVSTWAFGSQARFLSAARAWLSKNGLTDTTIVDPTGLDSRSASTPANLIALGKIAMAHPVVADIVGTAHLDVPGHQPLDNTNGFLGADGINGIKTGTLDSAGSCLLFSAIVSVNASTPLTIVGVVLGATDKYAAGLAAQQIIESVEAGFHPVPLVKRGDVFGAYDTVWKDGALVTARADATVRTWSDTPITSTIEAKPITTGKKGEEVGSITYVAGAETIVVPLVLDGDIADPGKKWRLTHPGELLLKE